MNILLSLMKSSIKAWRYPLGKWTTSLNLFFGNSVCLLHCVQTTGARRCPSEPIPFSKIIMLLFSNCSDHYHEKMKITPPLSLADHERSALRKQSLIRMLRCRRGRPVLPGDHLQHGLRQRSCHWRLLGDPRASRRPSGLRLAARCFCRWRRAPRALQADGSARVKPRGPRGERAQDGPPMDRCPSPAEPVLRWLTSSFLSNCLLHSICCKSFVFLFFYELWREIYVWLLLEQSGASISPQHLHVRCAAWLN